MTLFVLLATLFSCAPTCDQTCRKVLFECDDLDSERVALDACLDSCTRQRLLYEDQWEDNALADAFDDHRRCLINRTCDEIAAGECYDDTLFLFEPEPVDPEGVPFNPNASTP